MRLRVCQTRIVVLAICSCAGALPAAEDARAIVRRSITADTRNEEILRNYTYHALNEIRFLDGTGKTKSVESTLEEFTVFAGKTHVRRLEKNRKPLSAGEAAKERGKLDRAASEAAKLSPEARTKREQDAARDSAKRREEMRSIPDAFDFTLLGQEEVAGRAAWKIHATPKRDYKGPMGGVLRNIEGTLWVDQADYAWVRADAITLDTISLGLFLARLAPGSRLQFENRKVNGELWAPEHISVTASARLALLKKLNVAQEIWFSDYRRYSSDSRILSSDQSEK